MKARKLDESEHPPFGSGFKRLAVPIKIQTMLENLRAGEILEIDGESVPLQQLYFLFLYWARSKSFIVFKYKEKVHVQKIGS